MSKLVMQPSFRAAGQTHAEWQTFEKLENVWQSDSPPQPYCHTSVSYFRVFQMSAIPRVFGLGCITNFDMLFLVTGFISLVND